ncbi:MAG TPA: acetoacetate decarboxylase family protein, partial [Methylomirabilota bacterium]|nr:acetoacetate decarboxylase family protein [Methylomirabilota bacterium]
MPRFGTLDLSGWNKSAPSLSGYKTEPLVLKGAQILSINIEIDDDPADALLPRTMHPSIPAYSIFNVTNYPESPFGAFAIAEVRVSGRTGVRPRGFVLRSYCNNEDACRELASRWGYPTAQADVKLDIRHDRVVGRVNAGGRPILECELIDRDVIAGNDIQYIASMHMARNK